jgi:putative transposase
VEEMCQLFNIAKSGYYNRKKRKRNKREKENEVLGDLIIEIYEESRQTYGSPRIHEEIIKYFPCNIKRIERLMRNKGIKAIAKKKYKNTTDSTHKHYVCENILNRNFKVESPNIVWAGDITYIWTDQGWLYLAVVIDLFSRKVIGWSFSDRLKETLVGESFEKP